MVKHLHKLFGAKPAKRPHHPHTPAAARPATAARSAHSKQQAPTYSKTFRWNSPAGSTVVPKSVELVGSFSGWRPVPLSYESKVNSWTLTLDQIPGNKTHHYMLLVDGQPTTFADSDGSVAPASFEEAQYQLETPRGPRVFLLFAQTK